MFIAASTGIVSLSATGNSHGKGHPVLRPHEQEAMRLAEGKARDAMASRGLQVDNTAPATHETEEEAFGGGPAFVTIAGA